MQFVLKWVLHSTLRAKFKEFCVSGQILPYVAGTLNSCAALSDAKGYPVTWIRHTKLRNECHPTIKLEVRVGRSNHMRCKTPHTWTTSNVYHTVLGVHCAKEIRLSGCYVLWSLEGTDKPYISSSLDVGVSRLFEHEKLAGPSDTGHYVVATRLFHHSWAKWDMILGQRAKSQGWIFMVELPSGMAHWELCN